MSFPVQLRIIKKNLFWLECPCLTCLGQPLALSNQQQIRNMELLIKSLQGSYLVSGLESEATVADVKRLLHQQHMQQVPEPEEQCLVGGRHRTPRILLLSLAFTHRQSPQCLSAVLHTHRYSSTACCRGPMQACSSWASRTATSL